MQSKFVFFYGGPLSQWFPCKFKVGGVEYNSAEQFMMAMKATHFKDEETLKKIMNTSSPREQKALGRLVKNFNPDVWNKVAKAYVLIGNINKFNQNPLLRQVLLETKNKELVEASPYDTIWGIGLGYDHPDIEDKTKWRGTNWLGEVLMETREAIK